MRLRKTGAIPSLPSTPSWSAQAHLGRVRAAEYYGASDALNVRASGHFE